jgi:hypothetical protein
MGLGPSSIAIETALRPSYPALIASVRERREVSKAVSGSR